MGHCTQHASERMKAIIPMDKDFLLAMVSQILMEYYFYSLSDIDGEENARKITIVTLSLGVGMPSTPL